MSPDSRLRFAGPVFRFHHLFLSASSSSANEFLPIRHQLIAPRGTKLAASDVEKPVPTRLGNSPPQSASLGLKPSSPPTTASAPSNLLAESRRQKLCRDSRGLSGKSTASSYLSEDVRCDIHTHALCGAGAEANWAKQGRGRCDPFVSGAPPAPRALYKAWAGFATNGVT